METTTCTTERVSDTCRLCEHVLLSLEGVSDILLMLVNTHLSEEGVVASSYLCESNRLATKGVGEDMFILEARLGSPVFIDNVIFRERRESKQRLRPERCKERKMRERVADRAYIVLETTLSAERVTRHSNCAFIEELVESNG